MPPVWIYVSMAVIGYLIGSPSLARLVFARLKPGQKPDSIRTPSKDGHAELVSHAVGATNVMIAFGPRWGMLVTAFDILKGFLPTLAVRLIFPDQHYHLMIAAAILVGHLWPVWYRFAGGGGNSSIMGMLLAISPLGLLVSHAGGMLIGHFIPLFNFFGGIALTIPWFAIRDGIDSPELAFACAITLFYVLAELPEMRQIITLKRQGHELDLKHVLTLMRRSAASGKPGQSIDNDEMKAEEKNR
jgi:acyl phosphate:glycerol-3-phosphate acyltransferase